MEVPLARNYLCFKEGPENPQSAVCREGVRISGTQWLYDWNGYNANPDGNHELFVPDGQLCSAGHPTFDAANMPRTDWPATSVAAGANVAFTYFATAPHATRYHRIYVSRPGYDLNTRLRWADLQQICELGEVPLQDQRYRFTCRMPTSRSGKAILYHVWQRRDSPEAFYACIDVNFGGPQPSPTPTPVPTPTPPPTTTTTTTTMPSGGSAWQPGGTYTVGQIVTFQGARYRCRQSHTAHDPTWTPAAVPALWERL
jgi:chitin-binding protein